MLTNYYLSHLAGNRRLGNLHRPKHLLRCELLEDRRMMAGVDDGLSVVELPDSFDTAPRLADTADNTANVAPLSTLTFVDGQIPPLSKENFNNMKHFLQEKLEGKAAGYQFAVQAGDKVYKFADGHFDVANGRQMTNSVRQNLGSVSKMIISISILKLVDNGDIDLYDHFVDYLDDRFLVHEALDQEIHESVEDVTILDLLTHTSALDPSKRPTSANVSVKGLKTLAKERRLEMCDATTPTSGSPSGCARDYQNANVGLLRLVLEGIWDTAIVDSHCDELPQGQQDECIRDDGDAHRLAFQERIQELWLEDIGVGGMDCVPDPDIKYYKLDDFGSIQEIERNDKQSCSAGGWRGSSRDLLKILSAAKRGEILSQQMTDLLFDTTLADRSQEPGSTALGWGKPWSSPLAPGVANLGKDGVAAGVTAYVTTLPGQDNYAVLLLNTRKAGDAETLLKNAYKEKDRHVTIVATASDDQIVIRVDPEDSERIEVLVNDTIVFDQQAKWVDTITIRAKAGDDVIDVWDTHKKVEEVTINTNRGKDIVRIHRGHANTMLNVNTGDGRDTVELSPDSRRLGRIKSDLHVDMGGGNHDRLTLYDQSYSSDGAYVVGADEMTRDGFHLAFDAAEAIHLNAGRGDDDVYVVATRADTPLEVDAGEGDDTIHLSALTANMTSLAGEVIVHGNAGIDDVQWNDRFFADGSTYSIDRSSVRRDLSGGLQFDTLEQLDIHLGPGGDIVNVVMDPGLYLNVLGNDGDDTFNVTIRPLKNALSGGGLHVMGGQPGDFSTNDRLNIEYASGAEVAHTPDPVHLGFGHVQLSYADTVYDIAYGDIEELHIETMEKDAI